MDSDPRRRRIGGAAVAAAAVAAAAIIMTATPPPPVDPPPHSQMRVAGIRVAGQTDEAAKAVEPLRRCRTVLQSGGEARRAGRDGMRRDLDPGSRGAVPSPR